MLQISMMKYHKLFQTLIKSGMAGIITVSPYIGIRTTELITISVIQSELEMAAGEEEDDGGAIVGLGRSSLGFIEPLTPFSYHM